MQPWKNYTLNLHCDSHHAEKTQYLHKNEDVFQENIKESTACFILALHTIKTQ